MSNCQCVTCITYSEALILARSEDARSRMEARNSLCCKELGNRSRQVGGYSEGAPGGASRARSFIARSVIAVEIRYERRLTPSSGSLTQRDQWICTHCHALNPKSEPAGVCGVNQGASIHVEAAPRACAHLLQRHPGRPPPVAPPGPRSPSGPLSPVVVEHLAGPCTQGGCRGREFAPDDPASPALGPSAPSGDAPRCLALPAHPVRHRRAVRRARAPLRPHRPRLRRRPRRPRQPPRPVRLARPAQGRGRRWPSPPKGHRGPLAARPKPPHAPREVR